MEKLKTVGFTAKDEFNSVNSTPFKAIKNSIIKVTDLMIKDRVPDEDGKVETVGFIKDESGTVYATISDTVIEQLIVLKDIIEAEGPQDVHIVPKTSNGGREYFMLEIN
jgi:hypothetical protein